MSFNAALWVKAVEDFYADPDCFEVQHAPALARRANEDGAVIGYGTRQAARDTGITKLSIVYARQAMEDAGFLVRTGYSVNDQAQTVLDYLLTIPEAARREAAA